MLVPAIKILKKARAGQYAIPAFNINNLEALKAIMVAAVKLRSPLIVQTSEGAIEYAGMDYLVAMVKVAAKATVPIALHVDHGKDLKIIKQAIQKGYTSVMFDGSALPLKENIAKTKQVVQWAKTKKVSVEAEIGTIAGIEDFVSVAEKDAHLTNPEQAAQFVKQTGCDSLAVAIGTAHGAYKFKGETHLDIERLKRIAKLVKTPIVLHGASGVLEDVVKLAEYHGAKLGEACGVLDADIKQVVKYGVSKVNIDTDLRIAFTAGIRKATNQMKDVIDPRKLMQPANDLMTEVAMRKIILFKSEGKA